jgi:PKD repeat protein
VASAGTISVAVNPAARAGNVDIQAELLNGNGQVIASSNPVDGLGATLTANVASAGTYFVSVRGSGKGDLSTGYSSYGSVGEYAVTGTVPASASQPPLASLSANPTSGVAPLAVGFSAAGSSDPDGSIVSYQWSFGDGTSASGATASKTYETPGTYTATLKVTDNAGLTSERNVAITVTSPTTPTVTGNSTQMSIGVITMSFATNKGGQTQATAYVPVKDGLGNVIAGAAVAGTWSGAVSGSASGTTSTTGVASIGSSRTKSTGTFIFTVTGVTYNGYTYVPSNNTSGSATR